MNSCNNNVNPSHQTTWVVKVDYQIALAQRRNCKTNPIIRNKKPCPSKQIGKCTYQTQHNYVYHAIRCHVHHEHFCPSVVAITEKQPENKINNNLKQLIQKHLVKLRRHCPWNRNVNQLNKQQHLSKNSNYLIC